MTKEKLVTQLCEVIKESEVNAVDIFGKLENIMGLIDTPSIDESVKNSINSIIMDAMGLIQSQDLHRQKIERVVNYVCEEHGIDASEYNLAKSAKSIDAGDVDDELTPEELESLIKEMA